MSHKYKDRLKLHWVVVIYGFTAILGRLISIPALELVWYRMLLGAIGLGFWLVLRRRSMRVPPLQIMYFLLTGLVVAAHWLAFFGSIKVANVSIALACFATSALFTSFVEPIFFKRRVVIYEVALGLMTLFGLSLIFRLETAYTYGIILGVLAAFLSAVFQVVNKQFQKKYDPLVISFYELIGGFLGISLFLIPYSVDHAVSFQISWKDAAWLLILAWVCTSYAFAASVDVMKSLSAYNVVLAINMEPIYGIVLANIIFGDSELMTREFYIGTLIMLLSVFVYPILKRKLPLKNAQLS